MSALTLKTKDDQTTIMRTDVAQSKMGKKKDKPSSCMQAKSDVIRVLLLHKYGGVWADATLCMTEGLEPWLHMDADFTTFIRKEKISPA